MHHLPRSKSQQIFSSKTWQTQHIEPRPVKVGENNTGITTFNSFVIKVVLGEGDAMTYDAQFAFNSCWS